VYNSLNIKKYKIILDAQHADVVYCQPQLCRTDAMQFDSGKPAVTFGVGSYHGREGDFLK